LKICRRADGTADMFIKDVTIRDWDVAAPMLVLEEAGGFMLQYNGSLFNLSNNFDKNGLIVARSKKLINSILEFLDEI
jgi:fructose-1,6-bisphosphatase/inositol monophosphatase family enzyme